MRGLEERAQTQSGWSDTVLTLHASLAVSLRGKKGICYWDYVAKSRLKNFALHDNAVLTAAFNPAGTLFAYAIGYDFSRGAEEAAKKAQVRELRCDARVQYAESRSLLTLLTWDCCLLFLLFSRA